MLQLGIIAFACFSIVSALAGSVEVLIAGRGLMGIGAAMILPATLALIPPQFSGRAQLTAFGVWQAVAWGGQAVGPAIGGVITDGMGWRWLFWLNLPLAAGAVVVNRVLTPESKDPDASRHVDWVGLVTIAAAVFLLLYALTEGPTLGWTDPVIILLLVGAIALAIAWVLVERRVHDPLVDISLFRLRPYDGALTANLTMNLAFGGLSYLLVLWLQNARGYDPVEAGLLMLPSTLGIFLLIPVGGRVDERRGGRLPVLVGLMVMSAGLFVMGALDADTTLALIAVALVVVGLGLGLLSTPISNTAVGDVPTELAGTAAGVFKMSSMVGGAVGVALLSAFAHAFSSAHVGSAMSSAGLSASQADQATHALVQSASFDDAIKSLPAGLRKATTNAVVQAFSEGVGRSMLATGILAVVSTIVVAVLGPPPTPPQDRPTKGAHDAR
jgi:EmrB/QacA subfamily drug resistance transporter